MIPAVYSCKINVAEIIVCFVFAQSPPKKKVTALMTIINSLAPSCCFILALFFLNNLSLFDFLLSCVFSASGDTKSRVTDSSQSPIYRIRTGSEKVSLYSPEQSSLHESEGLLLSSVYLLQSPSLTSHVFYCIIYLLVFFLLQHNSTP